MYYITNQNGQVIAASSDLLALLQVESIDALYRQIALDAIEFATDNEGITLKTPLDETHYKVEEETLSSLLGVMTLVRLTEETVSESNIEEALVTPLEEEKKEEEFPSLEEETLFGIKENAPITETEAEKKTEEEEKFPLIEEEEEPLFKIKETIAEESTVTPEPEVKEEKDDLFDLILPSNAEETIGEIENEEVLEKATGPIYINVEEISQSIGISPEDYNTFLAEYIDTSLSLEDDLKSNDKDKRTPAIHTLFHLSNVLRLPIITDIIEQLKYTEEEDIESSIRSFYDTLSRLTTTKPETGMEKTTISLDREKITSENFKGFGTIDLSDVKPIHFDFQVEKAAKDLSLPAELIEEFIHDFIKQAHEETDKMLEAYEKGDLETIQKIGHLLKGTASNLRITPLADTLYEIQFCNDSSELEKLIKEYWGHFLSFETQFKLTSNKGI